MDYIPAVVQALPGEDFTVYAYFTDGTVRLVDVKPLIAKGGIFEPLADDALFRDRLTVMNDAIAWDMTGNRDASQCIDLDPCKSYDEGIVVPDPLEGAA